MAWKVWGASSSGVACLVRRNGAPVVSRMSPLVLSSRCSLNLTFPPLSNYMAAQIDDRVQFALKRHTFSASAGVQTDPVVISSSTPLSSEVDLFPQTAKTSPTDEDIINKLTADDLASILKWSREISKDINLSVALQRLTEIVTGEHMSANTRSRALTKAAENSGSQATCVVIAREVGDYTVATSMVPPEVCQVHE